MLKLCGILALLAACLPSNAAQVTIIDSGSTNVPGMTMKLERSGRAAKVERKDGSKQHVKLVKETCNRLLEDLKQAGPLKDLPASHCMKSASFGKSVFVEYKGVRSPDLSCPQTDPRAAALKKDVEELLGAVKGPNALRHY